MSKEFWENIGPQKELDWKTSMILARDDLDEEEKRKMINKVGLAVELSDPDEIYRLNEIYSNDHHPGRQHRDD